MNPVISSSASPRPAARLLAAAALGAALVAVLILPRPAHASGERVTIDRPVSTRATGTIPFSATTVGRARRVSFHIDGIRRWIDYRPKWQYGGNGLLNTRTLRAGRHRLQVWARFRDGSLRSDSTTVTVTRPTSDPAKDPVAGAPLWKSSFESGNFSEWTWWKRSDGCQFGVDNLADVGVPSLDGGRAGHFKTTAACLDAGHPHSKLFKEWAIRAPQTGWVDDAGRRLQRLPNDSPSGTYKASYYLPPNYTNQGRGWTLLEQFKVTNPDTGQLPEWFVNISPARDWGMGGVEPVLNVEDWGNGTYHGPVRPAPRGRWFEIRADVYNRDRIDFYIDGDYWQTVRNSVHAVGTRADSSGWIFGVGHYLGVGELWVDRVSFTPR